MTRRTSIPGTVNDLHRELAKPNREALQRRVYSMANAGLGEHTIADFLKLHVDQVRTILSERPK